MKCYRKEKRLLALDERSGSAASNRKPWPFFTAMDFLKDVKNESNTTRSSTEFMGKPKLRRYVDEVMMFNKPTEVSPPNMSTNIPADLPVTLLPSTATPLSSREVRKSKQKAPTLLDDILPI